MQTKELHNTTKKTTTTHNIKRNQHINQTHLETTQNNDNSKPTQQEHNNKYTNS